AALTDAHYDALVPVQWPLPVELGVEVDALSNANPSGFASRADFPLAGGGEDVSDKRFFADGVFFTSERKARFVAPEPPALREPTSETYPLRLNTGRIRDQWHSMTRTGKSPRLAAHLPEPFVEVHPQDADAA